MSENTSNKLIFGDDDSEEKGDSEHPGGGEEAELGEGEEPAAKARGRGRGSKAQKAKAKAKATGKKDRPSDERGRLGICFLNWCRTAPVAVELAQKQPSCNACVDDVATMRRDAKRSGKKSIKFLKDLETDHKKGKAAGLAQAWAAWKAIVGDKVPGISRISKFDWMRYEEKLYVAIGKTEKESTVPMTPFQYKEYQGSWHDSCGGRGTLEQETFGP